MSSIGTVLEGPTEWTWHETVHQAAALRALGNVTIEVLLRGRAAAAGLSFGAYKDLLVPLDGGECLLQLEIDWQAGRWVLRADGRVVGRQWWTSAIVSLDDFAGPLLLKAHRAERVAFGDVCVRRLESSCRMSVIITCHRFARRLRPSLRCWCRQVVPSGTLEVIVVNPSSPDETHAVVREAARDYPHVRIREIVAGASCFRNKGRLINMGVAASHGEWVWLTDADCLFPPGAAAAALAQAGGTSTLWYCERRHLTETATTAVLNGSVDPAVQFQALGTEISGEPDVVPWGYCQIVHRSTFDRTRYPEDIESFSASDNVFVERCKGKDVAPLRLEGLACLHLVHPWAWSGTNQFL